MNQKIVSLQGVQKTYSLGDIHVDALKEIDMDIELGEHVSIMGPSGSGKTTLLNILGCLDKPTQGSYYIDGREVSLLSDDELSEVRSRKIGFVFQSYNLIAQLTVLENIGMALFYQNMDERTIRTKAFEFAKRVGLEDRVFHRPSELSGGQQQRVAIARALVNESVLLLADEPTGNLDSVTGEEIMSLLIDLNRHGKTIIVVTHDLKVAEQAGRIVHMLDGKIVNE